MHRLKRTLLNKRGGFFLLVLLMAAAISYTLPTPALRPASSLPATTSSILSPTAIPVGNQEIAIAYLGTTPVTAAEWQQARAAAEVMMRLLAPPGSTLDDNKALESYLEDRLIADAAMKADYELDAETVSAEERRLLDVASSTPAELANLLTSAGIDQQIWREQLRLSVLAANYLEDVILADTPLPEKEQKRSQWLADLRARSPIRIVESTVLVEGVRPGKLAPDFLLNTLDGEPFRLSDARGKAVLVNFWASWCQACREEMPLLEQASRQLQNELLVLGVDVGEDAATVQVFIDELGITFPIVLDRDQSVTQRYRVYGIPTSFFIDAQGVIRQVVLGRILDRPALDARLKDILNRPQTTGQSP